MSGNKPMSDLTTNKVRISGYIALVLAIIFFSGLLKDAESFLMP